MKIKLLVLSTVLFLISCAQYKNTQGTRKLAREIQGDWTLSSVNYSKEGKYDVVLFNDTSVSCFISSKWKMIANNYKGSYEIVADNCSKGVRRFIFVLDEVDAKKGYYDLLIKPTDENYKSATNAAIRMHVSYVTENTMTLEQALILSDGTPFVIKMNFTKNQ